MKLPKLQLKDRVKTLQLPGRLNKSKGLIFIMIFAVAGSILLFATRAATPFASLEPEQGTIAGAACTVSDTTASAGSAIQFGGCPTGGTLNLPRIPWEGGPSYYKQFAKAEAAGWTNPSFFPIGVWFESVIDQSDIDLDKAAGLNTYVELTTNSNMNLIRNGGMFAVPSGQIPGYGSETVGWLLDDEVDMRYGPGAGYTVLQNEVNALPSGDGRFKYANFGKGVMMWETDNEAQQFVNNYTQVVSNDMYYYTDPNLNSGECLNFLSIPSGQCRRSGNYGEQTMVRMRFLDFMDNKSQPVWNFIEDGWPFTESASQGGRAIQPNELAGAVMNSLIYEARGILYFNHNFGGSCLSQHVLRDSCGAAIRPTVIDVNNKIKQLAPVLNTQSYQYSFNTNLSTMLKEQGGSYYIFAMQKRGSTTSGSYTLQLPTGLNGSTVEVMFENRNLPINTSRQFTDSFAAEYSYHIYKITP